MFEQDRLRNPIILNRPDYCPKCNSNSVEMFDNKNQPCKLTLHYNMGRMDKLVSTKQLAYMQCTKCKTKFKINWFDDESLIPMYDENYFVGNFVSNFKQHNKNKDSR